ncbi:MAG TPA: ornithine cyclodeaminase family protein, partial [Candidatus Limnocylindria bacterium]|nr:ornithine cyclodeaminase family protein [Candidatus Limnocylindria bacterium]
MSLRVLSDVEVARLLPMTECIEVVAEALKTLAREDAVQPLRSMVWMPDRSGLVGVMPAYLGSPRCLGLKAVSVIPGNHGTPYESHQGAVLLFEVEHGRLVAVVDASAITAIRTAAVSA